MMIAARDPGSLSSQAGVRREQILEAALEVMARQGFHHTSIADIAQRAHVSRATVYQYFSDKRGVLAALTERHAARIIAAVDAWAPFPSRAASSEPTAGSVHAQLRAMIDARIGQVLGAISANADAARLLLRLMRNSDRGLVEDAVRRIDDHVVGILTRDISAASEYGWARPCGAETIARYVLGGIEKLLVRALDREGPLAPEADAIVNEIGAHIFFGLAHPDVLRQPGPATLPGEETTR
jgi:AcrR family transcriptional regulator